METVHRMSVFFWKGRFDVKNDIKKEQKCLSSPNFPSPLAGAGVCLSCPDTAEDLYPASIRASLGTLTQTSSHS